MAHQLAVPVAFTLETWHQALANGRLRVIPTRPRTYRIPRALIAPMQFLQWTIRARIANPHYLACECG
jgi:hypothetical protein